MDIIVRKTYLSHIISHLNRGMMIILVGQRRVGKSFMLRQVCNWLEESRKGSTVVYINKELLDFSHITNARELHDYVVPKFVDGDDNYLLIDEVQDIEGYEDALRSLQAENRCQIIATGSNAYIFSSDLAPGWGDGMLRFRYTGYATVNFLCFTDWMILTSPLTTISGWAVFPV